ncbi:MAG: hypothetical protein SFV81_00870 [Pirellulaceae bacterium]|nr:hypothetical protein [Pirellulaceae bacterium]
MSNEPSVGRGDDELARRIAAYESEEWLGALKELKPVQGVDLYAIGFEAGKQAALVLHLANNAPSLGWFHPRTAWLSSMASVAATVLLMFALQDGALQDVAIQRVAPSGTSEMAEQTDPPVNDSELVPTLSAENEPRPNLQEPDPAIKDVLAELPSKWRDRMEGMEVQVANSEDSNHVVDVEPRRLRLAFQRRQLIENLGETIQ